jgi:hypothetical protein
MKPQGRKRSFTPGAPEPDVIQLMRCHKAQLTDAEPVESMHPLVAVRVV